MPKKWLRGLDSNQDNQLQRLVSCQLDDPGIIANTTFTSCRNHRPRVKWVKLGLFHVEFGYVLRWDEKAGLRGMRLEFPRCPDAGM